MSPEKKTGIGHRAHRQGVRASRCTGEQRRRWGGRAAGRANAGVMALAHEHQRRRRVSRHEARHPRHQRTPAQRRLDYQSLLDRGSRRRGDPNLGAYNASKGGVRLYTKSVAVYCAKSGLNIRVNSIHPGYIWTPMVENYLKDSGDVAEGRKAADECTLSAISASRAISPTALSISPRMPKFVTGSELVIDGGYTAQ